MNDLYDVVIIGAGLGGLVCGAVLAKEGYRVCVLEQQARTGGCFQSFRRNGHWLDTGIHYIGSMRPGQTLHRYFSYLGIADKLRLRFLDEEAFDVIRFGGREYPFACGHERFAETLASYFPREREGLKQYVAALQKVGDLIHPRHLAEGRISAGNPMDFLSTSAAGYIDSVVSDPVLRQVLAGNSMLYGGVRDRSNFYHYAMILNSYLEGACRLVDGSMQVTDRLADVIGGHGGTVRTLSPVTALEKDADRVSAVWLGSGERIEARFVISSLHPRQTLSLIGETPLIRKAYRTHLQALDNSYGLFSVYLLMKKNSYPYLNRNVYLHSTDTAWYDPSCRQPTNCLFSMQATSGSEEYADVVTLLTPMAADELRAWEDSVQGHRPAAYADFKHRRAQELIAYVEEAYPGLRRHIEAVYTATPLTYRDYTGTPDGSAYGIVKDYHSPLTTLIPVRTRLKNLLLTGQNLNVHGALGVTLTAMLTCSELLGREYLAHKVANV